MGWIKRVWHDPVGSNVIAAGIVALIGAVAALSIWTNVLGATGRAVAAVLRWLWTPVALPGVIVVALVVAAVVPVTRWWWSQRKTAQTPLPATPQPPKPLTGDDLNKNQKTLLIMLWRIYPNGIDLRHLLQNLELTYPAIERLAESLEKHGLVTITPGMYAATSVVLTKNGRDFCHENGLAVDH